MSILLILVLALSCLIVCSCHESKSIKVKPVKTVKALADTAYLSSQVSNLVYSDGRYYLSDYYRGIVSFSQNFDSVTIDGINALLPIKEQCYMFAVGDKGVICAYSPSEDKFILETSPNVYDSIKTEMYDVSLPSRFIFGGDTIICPIIKNKMTAVIFYNGKVIKTCFPTVDGLDDIRKPFHSERIMIRDGKSYFVIGKGLPLVQMYSTDFKLISSYDLRNIKEINETVEQQKTNKPNSYFVVVQDAYAADGKIYLLIASKPEGRFRCNKVLVLKTTNNKIEFDNLYELNGKVYTTLCINDKGQIVTVNSKTAAIEIYEF